VKPLRREFDPELHCQLTGTLHRCVAVLLCCRPGQCEAAAPHNFRAALSTDKTPALLCIAVLLQGWAM
jgi:hypothetical protein